MAGIDPQMVEELLSARDQLGAGKGGGGHHGRAEALRNTGARGPAGAGGGENAPDPQTEFDLAENNLATASHFASLGHNPGISTSMAATYMGNQRAARAEQYNNRIRHTEDQLRLLGEAEKLGYRLGPNGQLIKEEGGFEAGYKSPPAATPESGFNPQGAF